MRQFASDSNHDEANQAVLLLAFFKLPSTNQRIARSIICLTLFSITIRQLN